MISRVVLPGLTILVLTGSLANCAEPRSVRARRTNDCCWRTGGYRLARRPWCHRSCDLHTGHRHPRFKEWSRSRVDDGCPRLRVRPDPRWPGVDRAYQDLTFARLGWLSPAVAFDVVSAAFAGTDFLHHRHFIDFAERYRRALVNRMNADLIPNPAVNGREHTNDSHLWSQIPRFEYAPLPPSRAWQSAMWPLLALAGWLLGGAALLGATSMHVRP